MLIVIFFQPCLLYYPFSHAYCTILALLAGTAATNYALPIDMTMLCVPAVVPTVVLCPSFFLGIIIKLLMTGSKHTNGQKEH